MGKYFGTDGFRGEVNVGLTVDHAWKIGRFIGWYYTVLNGRPARIVIGKDTRRSSYMFEYAIAAGVAASGADAYLLHVTTTPSVSYVTRTESFDCGVMISASHNPYYDNGIKLVDCGGVKMDDETIRKIEMYIDGDLKSLGIEGDDLPLAHRDAVGRSIDYAAGRNRYIGYLISLASESFKDYRVGLDCANGSAWMIARSVFEALGAKTFVINAEPDGTNINRDAGSTHIEGLRRFVIENHLDAGFAYDGDADRCIAVDENGNEVNGDHIIYIFGKALKDEGRLINNKVVTTVMSNMGLYRALREAGIEYEQTTVGDKYVYENMTQNGHIVGGEQSGHIILSKYATTGDGILTSIKLMETVVKKKTTLGKLAEPVVIFPQVTQNIRVVNKKKVTGDPRVIAAAEKIAAELGESGRILIRESGTEPVVRFMVESESKEQCNRYTEVMCNLVRELGLDK
ncbi:MAG: phosphoglucosamine mutase [Eubacteriales bacterium]|nr:phosphoglucosamine mutase [Eubacteriales bacterium]